MFTFHSPTFENTICGLKARLDLYHSNNQVVKAILNGCDARGQNVLHKIMQLGMKHQKRLRTCIYYGANYLKAVKSYKFRLNLT